MVGEIGSSVYPARPMGQAKRRVPDELVHLSVFQVDRSASWAYRAVKRGVDIVGAVILLALFLPVMLVAIGAIWIETGQPMIYTQERVRARRLRSGPRGAYRLEIFAFYKLRTMEAGSDSALHRRYMEAYIAGDEESISTLKPEGDDTAGTYKMKGDPRITNIGRILRTLSLDEIPQFWNVIRGDMSLVGPRPPIPYEVVHYRPSDFVRFSTRPGLTGLWQVSGRSDLSFDDMIRLDREYVARQSVLLDLRILLRTIPAVLSGRGAG